MNDATQNSLFWIIVIFASLNPLAKGFLGESIAAALYFKQLIKSQTIIRAKLIYNSILMFVIITIIWLTFSLLIQNFSGNAISYLITLILAGLGISGTFTLMAALTSKLSNAFLILPVISLPIIIPILLVGIKTSKRAIDGIPSNLMTNDWLLLGMLVLFSFVMSEILYKVLEDN